ncbi:MAG TPA: VOC family protein [Gaiellaceae bacterium]
MRVVRAESGSDPAPRLFRVAVHVSDVALAVRCYETLLRVPPVRVGDGRWYFHCAGAILVCVDPETEGHGADPGPNTGRLYFAVDELDAYAARAVEAGCTITNGPELQDWGERSFYGRDPFGNPFCFVEAATAYTGASG